MEKNITLRNQKDLFEEVLKITKSLDLPSQLKEEMIKRIEKLSITDGITNLIFLGSMNSGKTTSINLLLSKILPLKINEMI